MNSTFQTCAIGLRRLGNQEYRNSNAYLGDLDKESGNARSNQNATTNTGKEKNCTSEAIQPEIVEDAASRTSTQSNEAQC